MPILILAVALLLASLWIAGEVLDKPLVRQIAGPLFAFVLASIAYAAAAIGTSFDASIQYSGATKNFVSALLDAIDRGDTDSAHAELREFDKISIETYEGSAFIEWLRDPVARLSADITLDSQGPVIVDANHPQSSTPKDAEP